MVWLCKNLGPFKYLFSYEVLLAAIHLCITQTGGMKNTVFTVV